MQTPREAASDLKGGSPVLVTAWRDRMPGIIKKTRDPGNATTEMEE
jgi:hypothetical protein